MRYIQGKETSLTLAKDGVYVPLPYSLETLRESAKSYSLPSVIGQREQKKDIQTGWKIQGCFTTRIEKLNILTLFSLLFPEPFDILIDRVAEKKVYKNLLCKGFELRGDNKGAFQFRIDVKESDNSFIDNWTEKTPDLRWDPRRSGITYLYSGKQIILTKNGKADTTLPLIYRFEIEGILEDKKQFRINLYYPLSDEWFPKKETIQKITIPLSCDDGINLEINNLIPKDDIYGTATSDTVLICQKFDIQGEIKLVVRNEKQYEVVTL